MTARTRCGLVKFRVCDELLFGRRYYVRPVILYGCEAWCLKKVRWKVYEGQRDLW